jgi:hypothetical protein
MGEKKNWMSLDFWVTADYSIGRRASGAAALSGKLQNILAAQGPSQGQF